MLMNGLEAAAVRFSPALARLNGEFRRPLAELRPRARRGRSLRG
jgi:hypothetical protein